MSRTRIWMAGATAAAVVVAVLLSNPSGAGDNKEIKDKVDKIAIALQKGDKDGAKKQAETFAKGLDDIAEAMDVFKSRKKGGFGVGDKPGSVDPDHIEQMLIKIAGPNAPAPNTLTKNAAALEQLGYRTAAMALVSHAKTPTKDMGKKTKKDWVTFSNEMQEAALEFAAAAKAKNVADIKKTGAKVYSSCNACHGVFR